MEAVKNWAFSICAAAICGAVLNIVLPEGGAQKTYKTVLCVFFLSVLVSPLTQIEIPNFLEISDIEYNYTQITENEFTENSFEMIEEKILTDTKNLLREKGITPKDISVKVNISESGSIDINKFVLTLDENPFGLSQEIYQKIGITPEIIVSGEN